MTDPARHRANYDDVLDPPAFGGGSDLAREEQRHHALDMSTEAERILEAALQLTESERWGLLAMLVESLDDRAPDSEAAWAAEAKRRLEDIRSGRSKPIPSEEVELELEQIIAAHESKRVTG